MKDYFSLSSRHEIVLLMILYCWSTQTSKHGDCQSLDSQRLLHSFFSTNALSYSFHTGFFTMARPVLSR